MPMPLAGFLLTFIEASIRRDKALGTELGTTESACKSFFFILLFTQELI